MSKNGTELVLRPARQEDAENIRRLLHATSRAREAELYLEHLSHLFVLICGDKLLGAISGSAGTVMNPPRSVVHPWYPETEVAKVMGYGLRFIISRDTLARQDEEAASEKTDHHIQGTG